LFNTLATAQQHSMSGYIRDFDNNKGIDLATIYLSESNQGASSNEMGYFEIKNIQAGQYHLRVSYVGYQQLDTVIRIINDIKLNLKLRPNSLQLKAINVMASAKRENPSSSVIQRTAIDHLQPNSIKDLMQLIPGNLFSDSKLNNATQMSMRQAGSDKNTALGTAIVVDGVPLSNDNNMQAFYGASGISDIANHKNTVNGGVDLRRISTDHIDEVEVIRGIPSAKYGDLSSGAVIVKTRKGVSPFIFRIKSDPLTKLFYAGKGIALSPTAGTLNLGVDYTHYYTDQRSKLEQFKRISTNFQHEIVVGKNLRISSQLAHTGTIDKTGFDADIMNKEDSYKSDYQSFRLKNSGQWNINNPLLKKIEYTVSAQYSADKLERTRTITLNSPMGLSLTDTDGENYGIFLPAEYLSGFAVKGNPLNLFAQSIVNLQPKIGNSINHLMLGVEYRYDKNFGQGSVYDLQRPPYPTLSSSSRPRAHKDIPALQKIVFFAEENFNAQWLGSNINIVAGIRCTKLLGVSHNMSNLQDLFAEPRSNLRWELPAFNIHTKATSIALRIGYGNQIKFPTLMQLYPEKAYFDIPQLNYYSNNAENRLIHFRTYSIDRTNTSIAPSKNSKFEYGLDIKYDFIQMEISIFNELSSNAYEQQTHFLPLIYKNYDAASYTGNRKPGINDFSFKADTAFYGYNTTTNAALIRKKGVEFQIKTKKIKALSTEFVMNGAWFKSTYDINDVRYKHSNIVVAGKYFPYVGIFDAGRESRVNSQLNTNIFFNTHIASQGLVFSTAIQFLWHSAFQMIAYDGIPTHYINLKGEKLAFTNNELNDPVFKPLIETFSPAYFLPEKNPVSIELNFRATKEINKQLRISFFVNRLIDYNPMYKTRFGTNARKWVIPFMGAEMQLKI